MSLGDVFVQAGRQRRTVKVTLKAKKSGDPAQSVEFEPYSARDKEGKLSFFCLDVDSCLCLNVELTSVIDAEITPRSFKPRFTINL